MPSDKLTTALSTAGLLEPLGEIVRGPITYDPIGMQIFPTNGSICGVMCANCITGFVWQ
jgi:hypothetical protein